MNASARPIWRLRVAGTSPIDVVSVPEDRRTSPFSGWTREHWVAVADLLLRGARRYASRGNAAIHVPGPKPSTTRRRVDGLEGYARTFLLAAYRLAASDGHAPGDLVDRYSEGLRTGTDPRSEEAWPPIEDRAQPIVEAALIALALHETRRWIWRELDDGTRQRVIEWLSGIQGKRTALNNWVLFPVIVQAFLKSVGAPIRQDEIDRNLDLVDSWYRRDGWYTDGPGQNYDHYVGWGLHFHTLMWSRIDGERSDPDRAAIYRRRVFRFLEQYRLLFAADGAPLYHGRSLTYRFAVAAPLWAAALVDSTPLAPGETRRIASGALRHFFDRGAVRNDVLTLGWHGEFLPMIQPYSGHGSPYWGSKGFCGLLLPEDHPVWTAAEEPMAVERSDFCVAMPGPGFLVQGTVSDGIVRAASHRSDHFPLPSRRPHRSLARRAMGRFARALDGPRQPAPPPADPHYARLAYSTHTAPECGPNDSDVDNQVTLIRPDGTASRRARIHCLGVADRFAASVFYPREPAIAERIETMAIVRGRAEVRIHHVSAPFGGTVRGGGFAIASSRRPDALAGESWAQVRRADGLTSLVASLHGYDATAVQRNEKMSPFGHHSAIPYATHRRKLGSEAIFVSLVVLTTDELDPDELRKVVTHVEVAGREVVVCLDGDWWFLQLVAPEHVDRTFRGHAISGSVRAARVSPDGSNFTLLANGNE
jgi:hypothetical protein